MGCGPPSSALLKKVPSGRPCGPPEMGPQDPNLGPPGGPKRGVRGAQNRGFRGSPGGPGGTPRDPPKMPKKWHFFGACGAGTRGGGGAPPTTLILLHNQRTPAQSRVVGEPGAPAGPRAPPRAPFAAPVPKGETTLASPCGSSGAAPRGVAWPGVAFRREPPCLRPAVGRPPPRLPPIACSCGGALGGRLCPLRRQPPLLRAEPARAAHSLPPSADGEGNAPEFFLTPPPPYVL